MNSGRMRLSLPILVLAAFWLVFNALTLTRYPAITCDEAFYARTSLEFVSTPGWPNVGRMFYLPHGRTYWLLAGLSLKLFGGGLFAGRLVSLLGLVGLAAGAYLIGQVYYDKRVGLWAATLTGLSWLAVRTGHVTRPDILAAAAGGVLVGLLPLILRSDRPWWAGLYGAALVLQLDLHFNQLHILWPIALILLVGQVKVRHWGHIGMLAFGGMLGGVLLMWLHMGDGIGRLLSGMMADPLEFVATYVDAASGIGGGGLFTILSLAATSFGRFWWGYYAWLAPIISLPQALLFAGGLALALVSGSPDQRRLALILVLSSITFAVVNARYQIIGYATIWLPLYFPLTVHAVDWLTQLLSNKETEEYRERVSIAVLSSLALIYLAGTLYLTFSHPPRAYNQAAYTIIQHVPADATIMTDARWWFALHADYDFQDELSLTPTNTGIWWNTVPTDTNLNPLAPIEPNDLTRPGAADHARDVLQTLQPDFILDDGVLGCLSDPVPQSDALTAEAQSACTAVETLTFPSYGTYTLYDCQ